LAARGMLPLGEIGTAHFQTLLSAAVEFGEKVEPELHGQAPDEPLLVDLPIDTFSLVGQIESRYGDRIVRFRCAPLKSKDKLRAWINHLALCAADPGTAHETVLLGSDEGGWKFSPVAEAQAVIASLLEIYWRGLSRPLPFFPESALAFAQAELFPKKNARSAPLDKARRTWNGSKWTGPPEKSNRYYAFCFLAKDPLDGEFKELARQVFGPLLRNSEPIP
ncbi:MAG: hypothetical protein JO270_00865, partial [Acidobacteriaceae bacterium]|nr:hypothetical protein [Acidobacteriaceae bacterium]